MNSVGGFHEGEIDGKKFHKFSFFSETYIPSSSSSCDSAINSDGDDLSLQPRFLCPSVRMRVQKLKRKNISYEDRKNFLPFDNSSHFPNIRSINQQEYLLDSDSPDDEICKLPVVPLFWCNNERSSSGEFYCRACYSRNLGTDYYLCVTCRYTFHKECVESPLEIKHPSHPFQTLQLNNAPTCSVSCFCCDISLYDIMYYCPAYDLSMHPVCAMKPVPMTIDHPKRHSHPLTFFPKQDFLPCNVCGLIEERIATYVSVACVFVVHEVCIYFPHVIRICRHHHRISFISSLPSGKWFCGVCRQEIDNHYGAYSCNKCSAYFVHTKCALREDVWDGEDLEGVPEEPDIIIEPFETIADGIILHFTHDHYLRLEISRIYDEDKFCQACILPIYECKYYSCMDHCDFILHQACANAHRKIHHALHPHPLMLKVVTNRYENTGRFKCDACKRDSCGFVYESPAGNWGFRLDLRCASVSEPVEYQGHEHPLFLALKPREEKSATCKICQEVGEDENYCRKLNCIECDYIICFRCATLPYKARYKHDKHLLTFREREKASDQIDWCDVCETKILYSSKGGFYECKTCSTSLHVDCLLGEDPYMQKPGQTIMIKREEFHILRNNTMYRPFCHDLEHKGRCLHKVFFKKEDTTYCSINCSF